MKMWSGRFRQPLHPEFERWQRSFPFDCRLLKHEVAASRTHARALARAGVITADELAAMIRGLEQIALQVETSLQPIEDEEAEDVHHYVERRLVALIGETGYKLHSGRSRNEQIATDLRLYTREVTDEMIKSLTELCEAVLARAEQAGDAALPAFTHLQPAEPVLVAHWLLAYVEMWTRDASRLVDCRKRLNVCPLGSGAVAGATLALFREEMALELGFEAPTANSMDATSDRDFALEFVSDLSLLALHLSRWAEEMIIFSTPGFGFIELPESFSTGSSAMPQKKNPDLLELVRGKGARLTGDLTALLVSVKGLPLAYNKDLQETQEPLFDAAETMLSVLPLVTRFMHTVAFNFERMREAAQEGFMNAWAAASYLVKRGVPFRRAHEQVGQAVQYCLEKGCRLQDLTLDDVCQFCPEAREDFYDYLSLESVLAIHDVPGGTAPARVRHAIAQAKKKLSSVREEAHAHA